MENYQVLISGTHNVFSDGWNGVGVYMCSGLYESQTFKRPIYIGSSIDLQYRIEGTHILDLNRNNHDNSPFQVSWNKHNEKDGFVWFLMESCEKEKTFDIEQKYLDLYRPFLDEFGGFNIAHSTTSPFSGIKHTKERCLKQSASISGEKNPFYGKKHSEKALQKMRNHVRTPEHCRKLSLAKLGSKPSQKNIEASSKSFKMQHKDGRIVEGKNLSQFARENNLNLAEIWKTFVGKRDNIKGWKRIR